MEQVIAASILLGAVLIGADRQPAVGAVGPAPGATEKAGQRQPGWTGTAVGRACAVGCRAARN